MKNRKDYQKDGNFFDLDRLAEELSVAQKEEFYAQWRKKIEKIVKGMEFCATKQIISRREMLAKGLTAGFATILAPTFTRRGGFSLFADAQAQGLPNFGSVVIEAYGGWVPSAQIYTGATNPIGQVDAVKAALGIRINNAEGAPQAAFGAQWKSDSQFITAFRAALNGDNALFTQISDRTQAIYTSLQSDDDNGGQVLAPRHLFMQVLGAGVSTAGARGNSGGGNYQETHPAALSVLQANNATQANNLPGSQPVGAEFTAGFAGNSVAATTAVQKAIEALTKRNIISKKAMEAEAKQNLSNNQDTFKNKKLTTPPGTNVFSSAFDAQTNLQQAFPNANANSNNIQTVLATIGHLVTNPAVQGGLRAPAGFVGLGGYDSHQGAATSRASATSLGDAVGRLLRLANARGQALSVHIYTDGSQFQSTPGNDNWVGDRGSKSAILSFHYRPTTRPVLAVANQYVSGGYNETAVGGGGDVIPLIGQGREYVLDAALAAEKVVLDTLAAHGQLSRWSKAQGTTYTPSTPGIIKFQV